MTKHKIGIVGGSGFIGLALAEHLTKSFQVKVVDKNPPKVVSEDIEFERCDIRKYDQVAQSLLDVNLVVHTAIVQIPLINEEKKLGYEVNILGTQNVCKVAEENPLIKGLILTSSWHVFGESGLKGIITEEFGFRPDKVQNRARLYALCKVAQETITRVYDELSEKIFGVVRLGTVLGERMPEKTAANLFIAKGLKGETITPYKDSMHRPMLYVNVSDVQKAFELYAKKILNDEISKVGNSIQHIVNLCWPEPVTILELADMTKDLITRLTHGKINPKIEVVDTGQPSVFVSKDKNSIRVDTGKAKSLLGLENLVSPYESLERIIKKRISQIDLLKSF
jgi:nucleoside-diphosphate-sugar epimerase